MFLGCSSCVLGRVMQPLRVTASAEKITWHHRPEDKHLNDYIHYSNLCKGKRCLGGRDRLCMLCRV